MKRLITSILAGAACALVLVIPMAGSDKPPATTSAAHSATLRSAWPPENLSGTITMADPKEDLLVVQGPDGVPFDMTITPMTKIWSGNQRVSVQDLEQYRNKQVSVRFVPERRGDVAESIRITG
jgi:hypothetical protein